MARLNLGQGRVNTGSGCVVFGYWGWRVKECKIRRYGSTSNCHECGLCWDTNDQNPPQCPGELKVGLNLAKRISNAADFLLACLKLTLVIGIIYVGASAWLLLNN